MPLQILHILPIIICMSLAANLSLNSWQDGGMRTFIGLLVLFTLYSTVYYVRQQMGSAQSVLDSSNLNIGLWGLIFPYSLKTLHSMLRVKNRISTMLLYSCIFLGSVILILSLCGQTLYKEFYPVAWGYEGKMDVLSPLFWIFTICLLVWSTGFIYSIVQTIHKDPSYRFQKSARAIFCLYSLGGLLLVLLWIAGGIWTRPMEMILNNLGSLALAGIVVSVLKYQPERMNTHRLLSNFSHFVPTESMLLSTDGMIISVNKHRFLCNGLTRSEMEYHALDAIFLSSSDIRLRMLMLSAGQEETSNLIVQARTPSNDSVPIRINLHPLKNAHMQVVYFLVLLYPVRNEQSVAHRIQQMYGLTTRETEVLDLLIQGESYLNIAEHLYISLNTVKSHTKSIYLKTSTANRNELQDLTKELENKTNKSN